MTHMKSSWMVVVALCVLTLAAGCGPGEDGGGQQEANASSPIAPYLDTNSQAMNGAGQCCLGWCHSGATYYHYGSRAVTQYCTQWVQTVCGNRGVAFADAYWGNCNEAYVNWLS